MKIEVDKLLTEKEHAAAQWLHQKPRPAFAFLGVLLLIVAIGVLWLSFFGSLAKDDGATRWAVLIFVVYIMLHWSMILPMKWRRIYRQQKSLQRPYSLEITDQGIAGKSENGEGVVPWGDYVRWKEGNGIFLLYLSDPLFQVIPFRYFHFQTDEQIEEFRKLLSQKVQK